MSNYFKIRKPIKFWKQHHLTVNSIFVMVYISKMLKYGTGNVNFNILTIGTEMFKSPGLLNCCLRGCIPS